MSEPSIYKSDIGESTVYDWNCPVCRGYNEEWSDEPNDGDKIQCNLCGATTTVIDD